MIVRLVEASLATLFGALIGLAFGLFVGDLTGAGDWVGWAFAIPAGINGLFGGLRGVYAWATPGGFFAFVLDSSWALISTTLGVLVNLINTFKRSGFSEHYSVRRNRHVFERGFALKRGFANTQGPVISNAGLGRQEPLENRHSLIERHEGLHVWQQRWFGPLHPIIYVVWGAIGIVVGIVYGVVSQKRRAAGVRIGKLVETAAYYDNPFEYWAYKKDDRWESNSAQPALKWGTFSWGTDRDDR